MYLIRTGRYSPAPLMVAVQPLLINWEIPPSTSARTKILLVSWIVSTQGSRLRRPSILNTRYFRFGRKFRLSVHPSGRDFYEGNISALEANFGGRKRRYASNIYNTENKLYILKLNGFERFPGKLFTSTIVKRDISYTSISTQNVIYRKKA